MPDVDVLKCWAQENNIHGTLSVLCNNATVKELILNDMLMWGKQIGLKTFEQVSIFVTSANVNGSVNLTVLFVVLFFIFFYHR